MHWPCGRSFTCEWISLGFNNAYDMVDVDNVMKMDVARANEKEVIVGMPKLGDGLKRWSQ
jgi:hypothetical protein